MNKRTKAILSLVTTLVVSASFIGCGKKAADEPNKPAEKKESKEIVLWSHLTEPEVKEIDKLAQEWAKEKGHKVKVVVDKSDFQAFLQAANSSKGPDIMFGIAHDNLGTFHKAGLLAEVPSGLIDEGKYSSKSLFDACSYDGKRFAVPVAQESIALFYNTDKVKEAPKTVEDLVKVGKEVGFQFDINNFYISFPFIAGNGGYVFKDNGGSLDPKDIGLGNEGAKKGYEYIQNLVTKEKLMPADLKGDIASGNFKAKKTGLYISGPWDVKNFQDANVPFKVATLPQTDGKATPAFLGVQSAFVSARSKNQDEAWDLVKYLSEKSALPLFKTGNRIPVLNDALNSDEFKKDPYSQVFAEQAKSNIPMPNIPQMQAVWGPAGNNLQLLTAGKTTPEKAAEQILKQVEEGIAQQK